MIRGLGKGLEALFSTYEEFSKAKNELEKEDNWVKDVTPGGKVIEIDIRNIIPNKGQPRKKFDSESLRELAKSIKSYGVIQPIIVGKNGKDHYVIIAGERRYRASLIAGKTTIPAIVKRYNKSEMKEVSLVENLQREDLNPIEAARAIRELIDTFGFTQEEIADKIGKSRPLVTNTLRLLNLEPEVIAFIEANKLSAGHGKTLASIMNKKRQVEVARLIVENKLSVREAENIVSGINNQGDKPKVSKKKAIQSAELKEILRKLQRIFKTNVKIYGDTRSGRITIYYYNPDDLDSISTALLKIEDS